MSKAMLLYKDLCTEIDILELHMNNIAREYKNVRRMALLGKQTSNMTLDYSSERVSGGLVQLPLYDGVGKLDDLIDKYESLQKELKEKKQLQKEIEEHLQQFEGVDYKVARMRIVENKSLYDIADELGYSYDYIRKVNARMGKTAHSRHKKIAKS